MKRRVVLSLVVGCSLFSSAWGESFEYDFGGVLSNHFAPVFPNPNSSISQNDVLGQLEYSTPNGRLHGDNATGLSHLHFQPRYDQSWSAAVDVGLPASYDNSFLTNNPANQNPEGDSWLEVGIAAIADADADELFVFSLALEPVGSDAVRRILLATDESTGTGNEIVSIADYRRLSLSFDGASKELSALVDEFLLFSIDLGPAGSNWEMADNDTFHIALFGSTGHQDVSLSEPLTYDNFSAMTSSGTSPSDFNFDGDVDGDDLAQWESDFGHAGSDADDDGDSDGADFLAWQRQFGSSGPAMASAGVIPEPTAVCLLLVGTMAHASVARMALCPGDR